MRALVDAQVRGLDQRDDALLAAWRRGRARASGTRAGRERRGDLAGLRAAHPVGDREERRRRDEGVLVVAPLPARRSTRPKLATSLIARTSGRSRRSGRRRRARGAGRASAGCRSRTCRWSSRCPRRRRRRGAARSARGAPRRTRRRRAARSLSPPRPTVSAVESIAYTSPSGERRARRRRRAGRARARPAGRAAPTPAAARGSSTPAAGAGRGRRSGRSAR